VDRNLIDRARRGDHDAFTLLVAGTINGLFATARLILRSDDRAEDAVQDALLRAWLGLPGLHDPDRFEAWVRRLLVHACYRAARHERARQLVEIRPLVLEGPAIPDGTRLLVNRDLLERGFRRLAPEQRAVLVVHYYLDLSDAEAAEVLGIPIGTMKSRLNRATSALRAALDADEREPLRTEEAAR
jgi:RNA polymerase sigma-70 factor (ECF subfamily)